MHTLAAYSLSREFSDHQTAVEFLGQVRSEINAWLKTKNAHIKDSGDGEFRSKNPDGAGTLTQNSQASISGSYDKIILEELSGDSEIFSTRIYTAISNHAVIFYCDLQVEGLEAGISRARVAPRCPAIVRRIAELSPEWIVNGANLPSPLIELQTEAEGVVLAQEIVSTDRRTPIIVVAKTDSGSEVWPQTASDLAYELFGLARIVLVNDEATYGLSEQDVCSNSIECYDGAIRLYWPRSGKIVPSQLWTQHQLLARDRDGRGKNRIKRDIKELVMSAATISNPRPALISKIDAEATNFRISSLEASSGHVDALTEKVKSLESRNEELATRLAESERRILELSTKLKYQTTYQAPPVEDDTAGANDDSFSSPQSGEVRFYKKIADKGSHDLMRPYKDCGHNSWQNSASADKARKGLEKLEGRSDWKNVWHCGSCTGGGVWKVRW